MIVCFICLLSLLNSGFCACFCCQISLKIEEKDVENALKDRALLGSILAAGLP